MLRLADILDATAELEMYQTYRDQVQQEINRLEMSMQQSEAQIHELEEYVEGLTGFVSQIEQQSELSFEDLVTIKAHFAGQLKALNG